MGLMKIRIIVVFYSYLSSSFLVAYILGEFPSIRPVPCESRMTGETGICTFNWSCVNVAHGVHIGPCVDRFFVGSCCKIPENSSFVARQPTRFSNGETETTKEDTKMESFSEVTVFTPRLPAKQQVNIPNTTRNRITDPVNSETHYIYDIDNRESTSIVQRSTDSHLPSVTPAASSESSSETPLPSISRKPVLLEALSPLTSSSDSSNFAIYTQNSGGQNVFTPDVIQTTHLPDREKYSVITHFQQYSSLAFQSSHEKAGVPELEKNNHSLQQITSLYTESAHILNPFNAHQSSELQNEERTAESENIEEHISFVLHDIIKLAPQLGHHNDKLPNNTFFTWAYNFLNKNKNATYGENNVSSIKTKLNSTILQSSSMPDAINPSQLSLSEPQHEDNNFNAELDTTVNEIDTFSTASFPEIGISVNIEDVLLNFTKFTEPTYPWPSPKPSASDDPAISVSEAVVTRNISRVCGRSRSNIMARIVGGRKSHYLRWPWMISLRRFEGKMFKHKCGAALLNELWAITAAHCVDGKLPNDMILRLGEYNFHRSDEFHPHLERRIYMIIIHPQFDPATYENDLALLRFYEPVAFQANIVPVCLPKFTGDLAGRTAVVTGWGRLSEEGELPGSLYEVQMPILTNKECEEMYSQAGYSETIRDVFVCAGLMSGGLDACEGDSGGPMVVRGERGQWTLVGLISWGMGCAAPRQPGVYTRITKFVDWIDEIIIF